MHNKPQKNLSFFYYFLMVIFLIFLPCCSGRKKLTKKQAVEKKESKEQRPFRYKKIERLTFDEALDVYYFYKKQPKKPQLASVIERIIALTTDHDFINPLLIELADLMFESGNYKKAEEYYTQHATMYPGSSHIDYVKTRQIESAYKQILDVRRDQSKTKETRKLIESYLLSLDNDNPKRKNMEKILDQCYMILLESELLYINFYLNRYRTMERQEKALDAAYKRLHHINTTLIPFIKAEHYQNVHNELDDFFADEHRKQDIATIEKIVSRLQVKKEATPARNRF